jgi:hydrogenase nickel incorporation protein HypB
MCQDCSCSHGETVAMDGEVSHHSHHRHYHAVSTIQGTEDSPRVSSKTLPRSVSTRHTLPVHTSLLSKNDRIAERNRGYFQAKGLLVLNILSSPGSGKTAFLERMIQDLSDWFNASQGRSLQLGVIVGDLETDNDARRLRQAGAPAIQITTGNACHLEAEMVARAMTQLDLDSLNLLVIENVGNLVCPAAYDLGETMRVVLLSVTEGEDKPLKYPTLFKTADVVIINKIDLADVVGFNRDLAIANVRRVAPQANVLEVSANTGQGMEDWYAYLELLQAVPLGLPS